MFSYSPYLHFYIKIIFLIANLQKIISPCYRFVLEMLI
nr:MAG TPA: hypothetical protein [Caudoviricetes sp.]